MTELQKILDLFGGTKKLTTNTFSTPPHLAGLGDLVMSAYQKIFDNETVKRL